MTISRDKLTDYCARHGYYGFLSVSARTGEGCAELRDAIEKAIPWDRLPWNSTPRSFATLRSAILHVKAKGSVLIRISELRQRLQMDLRAELIEESVLRGVVGMLARQGLIRMLDFGDFVLMQPEQIDNYASAVVRCVQESVQELGSIAEQAVSEGRLNFPPDMRRLEAADETVLLRAIVKTFVSRSLASASTPPRAHIWSFRPCSDKTGQQSRLIRMFWSPIHSQEPPMRSMQPWS